MLRNANSRSLVIVPTAQLTECVSLNLSGIIPSNLRFYVWLDKQDWDKDGPTPSEVEVIEEIVHVAVSDPIVSYTAFDVTSVSRPSRRHLGATCRNENSRRTQSPFVFCTIYVVAKASADKRGQ